MNTLDSKTLAELRAAVEKMTTPGVSGMEILQCIALLRNHAKALIDAAELLDLLKVTPLRATNAELEGKLAEVEKRAAGLEAVLFIDSTMKAARAALPIHLHPATRNLVYRFARALAEKLAEAQQKYGHTDGWRNPNWMEECQKKLVEHVAKGDPRDVAAYCAFLWHHGVATKLDTTERDQLRARVAELEEQLKTEHHEVDRLTQKSSDLWNQLEEIKKTAFQAQEMAKEILVNETKSETPDLFFWYRVLEYTQEYIKKLIPARAYRGGTVYGDIQIINKIINSSLQEEPGRKRSLPVCPICQAPLIEGECSHNSLHTLNP